MADANDVVDETEEWAKENIPDAALLFYRIHRHDLQDGKPKPGAFRNMPKSDPGSGMSTNWAKYSTPEETRHGARQPPEEYAVLQLEVGAIRQIPDQIVDHTPNRITGNRSHTDVFGDKSTEVRLKMMNIYTVLLYPAEPQI